MSHPALHKRSTLPAAKTIAFVYTGTSSLSMVGGATGRVYRFAHAGASLALDARDAPGAAAIGVLRRDDAG